MKKIYYIVLIVLISLILNASSASAEFTFSHYSNYTNRYLEGTNGEFVINNMIIGYEYGDTDWPAIELGFLLHHLIVTNGYSYLPTGTEIHYCNTNKSEFGDAVVESYIWLPDTIKVTVTNTTTLTWHWDTKYRTEVYVHSNNLSHGSVSFTNGWYEEGTNIQITAIESNPSYLFDHWEVNHLREQVIETNFNRTINTTITNASIYTAYFVSAYYLKVTASSNGTIKGTYDGIYKNNSLVEIEAKADFLYKFSHWSGDIPISETNNNPAVLYMNRDRDIVANFVRISAPEPIMTDISITNGFYFKWIGEVGREYTVQTSTNLLTWTNLIMVVGTGDMISYTDVRNLDKAFYRLSVY